MRKERHDKEHQMPHISKWLVKLAGSSGASCWTRLALFSVAALPSLKEYMEEEEISKFKALILEKVVHFIALGEDLAYFQPYTVFYDKAMN